MFDSMGNVHLLAYALFDIAVMTFILRCNRELI